MPLPVCRIGDMGVGVCNDPTHPGRPITANIMIGSFNVTANNIGRARMGDLVMASCGHVATMAIGNPLVLVNNMPGCRMGDLFSGTPVGTIIIGSPNVLG